MKMLCRVFGHAWITTHVNRYQMPTRQQCGRCHVAREWRGGVKGGWYE